MWWQIAGALNPANATEVLDSLAPAVKEQLRAVWLERPPAVYIAKTPVKPGDLEFQAVCVRIVRWCEVSGPSEITTEPDGLTRVRVEGDFVRESFFHLLFFTLDPGVMWRPSAETAFDRVYSKSPHAPSSAQTLWELARSRLPGPDPNQAVATVCHLAIFFNGPREGY